MSVLNEPSLSWCRAYGFRWVLGCRNLPTYSKLVGSNAGAKVIVKWIRYGGVPGMAWLYCQRVGRGSGLLGLDSYMYHMCRATCHKTNYVTYCAQHLATHAAMHPKLRATAEAMMSVSALGKREEAAWALTAFKRR